MLYDRLGEDSVIQQKYWFTSWTQIIHTRIGQGAAFSLPAMTLLRGLEPDLIYHLLAPWLVKMEPHYEKAELERLRHWAKNAVLGKSQAFPAWEYFEIDPDRVSIVEGELQSAGVVLFDAKKQALFTKIVDAYIHPISWEDFAMSVIRLLPDQQLYPDSQFTLTLHCHLRNVAMHDLSLALEKKISSVAAIALEALGWTLP